MREVSVLERPLYERGVCFREALCMREVSVLERPLYERGVCFREASV